MSFLKPAIAMSLAACAVVIGASTGAVKIGSDLATNVSAAYLADKAKSDMAYEQLNTATNLTKGFQHVATALRPSVVSISTESTVQTSRGNVQRFEFPFSSPFFEDDFFREIRV